MEPPAVGNGRRSGEKKRPRQGAHCPSVPREGKITPSCGDVAQLGERRVRNAKVEGSIPFHSTKFPDQSKTNRSRRMKPS